MKRTSLALFVILAGCDMDDFGLVATEADEDTLDEEVSSSSTGSDSDPVTEEEDTANEEMDADPMEADGEDFPGNNVPAPVLQQLRNRMANQGTVAVDAAPDFSDALVDLGQALAFDKELSGNRDISCMTCHHPTLGTADARSLPIGVDGEGLGMDRVHPEDARIPRNAPPLFNLHAQDAMFWDGRVRVDGRGRLITPAGPDLTPDMAATLTTGVVGAQAMFPVTSREEMRGVVGENELAALDADDFAGIWAALMDRLGAIPEYVEMFEEAYPGESFEDMTFAHAANAIGAFEIAAFESRQSPFDAFLDGNDDALSDAQVRGAELFFGPARCAVCHNGPLLTDERFHNTGMPQIGPGVGDGPNGNDDFGLEGVTGNAQDRYAFRSTPLRNVELTAPYGHAGQFVDLGDFTAHYDNPQQAFRDYDVMQVEAVLWDTLVDNEAAVFQTLSPLMNGININNGATQQLVAFMESMTDPAMRDLEETIPARVPSGLPVAD